jgi:hypothetical protein
MTGFGSSIPRHKRGDSFLKGPIPWNWLVRAAQLKGSSLAVALAVWRLAGIKKTASVECSMARAAREFGFDERSGRRGLAALERAGLVRVRRRRGRKPVITLQQAPTTESPGR